MIIICINSQLTVNYSLQTQTYFLMNYVLLSDKLIRTLGKNIIFHYYMSKNVMEKRV